MKFLRPARATIANTLNQPGGRCCVLLAACFWHTTANGTGIDGAELAASCRTAQAAGYRGVAAAACEWYLDPCGACAVDAPPRRWCVPEGVTIAVRAGLLFDSIDADPTIGVQPAAHVVETLLSTHFPCSSPRSVIEEQ